MTKALPFVFAAMTLGVLGFFLFALHDPTATLTETGRLAAYLYACVYFLLGGILLRKHFTQ